MAIILDHRLREEIPRDNADFPISYFRDELASLPNFAGPLHWHPEFEIASALFSTLDFQVGNEHITLDEGDSIFVNGNVLHGIRQIGGEIPDPMPNVVFSGALIASEQSAIAKKYIAGIYGADFLPYFVIRRSDPETARLRSAIERIYSALEKRGECYELAVVRDISEIIEYVYRNLDTLPKSRDSRIQITAQVRIQKMLSYIYEHYREDVSLLDIAGAANVSRSEAGRIFSSYMSISPIEALIRHRLNMAQSLLSDTELSLGDVAFACGFHSVSYFSRQFVKKFGYAPGKRRKLGK